MSGEQNMHESGRSDAAPNDEPPTLSEAIELMREACEGWPQPNAYDEAMDVIEASIRRLDSALRGHGPHGESFRV